MRFAFVTDELPRPAMAGHWAMNHAIIAWLQDSGHDVTVFLLRPRMRSVIEYYDAAPVIGIGVKHWRNYLIVGQWRAALGIVARGFLARLPASVGTELRKRLRRGRYGLVDTVIGAFVTPGQAAWCAREFAKLTPDAVFADTIFRATVFLDPALAQTRRVIIAHDLFYLRHRALLSAGYRISPPELSQAMEAGYLNMADVIAAIQPEEATSISEMCPDKRVCTLPMPAMPCPRPETTGKIPGRLVFVGSATLPNTDGLRWLFAEIWPLLKTACPNATLDLVGDCGNALPHLPAGVMRLGRVKDMSPILHRSVLAISPLRVGSGLKIKILDYARHGLITVATPQSLQGFAADTEAPFVPAEDAREFAAGIAARLADTDAAAEQRAMAYVLKYYNVNSSFAALAAALGLPQATSA